MEIYQDSIVALRDWQCEKGKVVLYNCRSKQKLCLVLYIQGSTYRFSQRNDDHNIEKIIEGRVLGESSFQVGLMYENRTTFSDQCW